MPRLPTFPARWVLEDPRRRAYFVFWTSGEGDIRYGLKMAPSEAGDAVLITFENEETPRISILRRPLPRGTGTALFYRCLWCQKPRRYLYRLTRLGKKLVDYLGLRCQVCARLRFGSQGRYRGMLDQALSAALGAGRREPLPRQPWDPRAVSDPRMVLDELDTESRTLTADAMEERPLEAPGLLRTGPALVCRGLDGRHSVWLGSRCLGRYDARGRLLTSAAA